MKRPAGKSLKVYFFSLLSGFASANVLICLWVYWSLPKVDSSLSELIEGQLSFLSLLPVQLFVGFVIFAPFTELYLRICERFQMLTCGPLVFGGMITPLVTMLVAAAIIALLQFRPYTFEDAYPLVQAGLWTAPPGAVAGYVFWFLGYKQKPSYVEGI